jgi:DNA-binding NarL/FixJ family response regulator
MPPLRVLIVADDPLVRGSLARLIEDQQQFSIAGQVPSRQFSSQEVSLFHSDVVLWDLGWEPVDSIENFREGVDRSAPILMLVPDHLELSEVWFQGLGGVLTRNINIEQLTAALQAIAKGLTIIDPVLLNGLPATRTNLTAPPSEALTPREMEVLRLLVEGLPNKGIAQQLQISDHTVKFHVNAIMGKLGAQSRTDAVVKATRLGLISL